MTTSKTEAVASTATLGRSPAAIVGISPTTLVGGICNGRALPLATAEAEPTAMLLKTLHVGSKLYDQATLDAAVAAERERCVSTWNALLLELREMADDSADRGDVFAQRVVTLLSRA